VTRDRSLWAMGAGLYGPGDLATTWAGLRVGAVERHPAAAQAIADSGPWILVPWTLGALALFAGAYLALDGRPERRGIPIGLAVIGAVLVANNLAVIAAGWSA
jgi:hypothetical protein